MTGWIIYGAILVAAILVFIGTPLAIRLNGYQGRHIRKDKRWKTKSATSRAPINSTK